jgi:adhesin/invasin
MRFRSLRVALLLLATTGCYDGDKYAVQSPSAPSGTPADEILAVTAAPTSVQADGISRTTITARIDSRSTVKTVTFETSRGSIVGAKDGKLQITADGAGVATAELQSETTPGNARVTVTVGPNVPVVGNVVRVLDVPFTAVSADQLLTIETSSAEIGADGFSTATITARLTVNGNRQQPIKFSTSLGTLVRTASGTGGVTDTITADVQGVATIFLRSEATVGTAVVTAEMSGFTRQVLVAFKAVNPNDIITVRAEPSSVPADGSTGNGTVIYATVSPSIPQAQRQVKFDASNGSFVGSATVTPDASNVAHITLKSSTAGTSIVTATVSGFTARTTVDFARALPDNIFVQSNDSVLTRNGNNSTQITVTLTRAVGQVSNNTVVVYSAVDANGNSIGRFTQVSPAVEDTNDSSTPKRVVGTAVFDPDDSAAIGTATITATVGSVKGTLTIQLQ